MQPTLIDAFLAQQPTPLSPDQIAGLSQTLDAVKTDEAQETSKLVERATIGRSRNLLTKFLLADHKSGIDDLNAHFGCSDRYVAMSKLLVRPDLTAFNALMGSGETAIVLQAHAGVNMVGGSLNPVKVPMSLISTACAGTGSDADVDSGRPGDFDMNAIDDAMAMRFAKRCQLMRKGPRIVRIFPDGGLGGSFAADQIAGREVKIGRGAATLAYCGRSTFWFAGTRWTQTGVAVDFTRGPKVQPDDSKARAEEMRVQFYSESVTALLRDDPVDFGLRGGYWQEFLTPQANAGAPE